MRQRNQQHTRNNRSSNTERRLEQAPRTDPMSGASLNYPRVDPMTGTIIGYESYVSDDEE